MTTLNATTSVQANFGSTTRAFVGGTNTDVNETQGLFAPGDNLDPTGAANLNGAIVTFEYGNFSGGTVSGTLLTDNFAAGGANCRVSGMVFGG